MRSQIFLAILGLGTVQTGLAATGKSFTGWDWYDTDFIMFLGYPSSRLTYFPSAANLVVLGKIA